MPPLAADRCGPGLDLYCLPYAGGSAAIYRSWTNAISPDIAAKAIELPGRGRRFAEPPTRDLRALVATLMDQIDLRAGRPFAFFGHSMGALLAFELARAVRRESRRTPIFLFVSACRAPQVRRRDEPRHTWSDARLIDELRRLNGTPAELLDNEELLGLLLPVLRADLGICDGYRYEPEPPLDCPILAFGGLEDEQVSATEIAAWSEQTRTRFDLQMLPGDHFFLNASQSLLLQAINAHLAWPARQRA
ncbi:MAG: alpha/beta fold hydrolase [Methylotetracoccus sp.]